MKSQKFGGFDDGSKRVVLRMKLRSSSTETYSPELPQTGGYRSPRPRHKKWTLREYGMNLGRFRFEVRCTWSCPPTTPTRCANVQPQ